MMKYIKRSSKIVGAHLIIWSSEPLRYVVGLHMHSDAAIHTRKLHLYLVIDSRYYFVTDY